MKNQSITIAKPKTDFVDLSAKNPLYQPLAGKVPNTENRPAVIGDDKKNDGGSASDKIKTISSVEAPKSLSAVVQTEQAKVGDNVLKTGPAHEKSALNLEGTLKLVDELHRRVVQRGRLVYTIDNLDKFEIEQKEEAEDTTSNYYQGCELEITDDKRNKFSTKNPVIIKAVATFVRDLCITRLGEIEAEIIIPV